MLQNPDFASEKLLYLMHVRYCLNSAQCQSWIFSCFVSMHCYQLVYSKCAPNQDGCFSYMFR